MRNLIDEKLRFLDIFCNNNLSSVPSESKGKKTSITSKIIDLTGGHHKYDYRPTWTNKSAVHLLRHDAHPGTHTLPY